MKYGYTLFCEGNAPKSLVDQAIKAEKAGFDFLVISDHFHPWLPEQSHSGFAWSILGAVAQATNRIGLATMVTCPTIRYHPAIIAQAAATIAILSDGRFTLGLGSGENLNEHVVGRDWPPAHVRQAMLKEALEIINGLWTSDYYAHDGRYFQVYDAKIFDKPDHTPDIFVAAGGSRAASLAAETGGIVVTEASSKIIDSYIKAGGDKQKVWGQIVTAWSSNKEDALNDAHRNFRFAIGGWKVQAELPNPVNFGAATSGVSPADLEALLPAGPDPNVHAEAMKKYTDAGVTQLAVAYPGEDFDGFFEFWSDKLKSAVPASK